MTSPGVEQDAVPIGGWGRDRGRSVGQEGRDHKHRFSGVSKRYWTENEELSFPYRTVI